MAVIDELLISLGFELDKKSLKDLKDLEDGFLKAAKGVAVLVAGAVAGTVALVAFTKSMSNTLDDLAKSARKIGTSAQELDELGFAMRIVTGSSDALGASLENFSKKLSEADRGTGEGVEVLGRLGVSTRDAQNGLRGVRDVLIDVLKETSKLSDSRRLDLLDKLGLGDLTLASKNIDQFTAAISEARDLGILSQEDLNRAEEFNDAIERGRRVVTFLGIAISSAVAPALTEIVDGFKEWIVENQKWLKQDLAEAFETLGEIIKFVAGVMGAMVKTTLNLIRNTVGLNNALKIMVGIFATLLGFSILKTLTIAISLVHKLGLGVLGLNLKLLAIPLAIAAIIALMALLIEDTAVFFKGGDSVLGRLSKGLAGLIDQLKSKLIDLSKEIRAQWQWLIDLMQLIGKGTPATAAQTSSSAFSPGAIPSLGGFNTMAPMMGGGGGGGGGGMMMKTVNLNHKVDLKIQGNATGVSNSALAAELTTQLNIASREALKNIETGIEK